MGRIEMYASLRDARFMAWTDRSTQLKRQEQQAKTKQMLAWEQELELDTGTVEALVSLYKENAYQIMAQAIDDPDAFLRACPPRIKLQLGERIHSARNIIKLLSTTELNPLEKTQMFNKNENFEITPLMLIRARNEQKEKYGLPRTASLTELGQITQNKTEISIWPPYMKMYNAKQR